MKLELTSVFVNCVKGRPKMTSPILVMFDTLSRYYEGEKDLSSAVTLPFPTCLFGCVTKSLTPSPLRS